MKKSVWPSEIRGTITAPPSKSIMQRAVAAAILSDDPVTIINPGRGDDCQAAIRIVRSLGARVEWTDDRVTIQSHVGPRKSLLDCGESGLCLRMFTPIAALYEQEIQLTGHGSLRQRPLGMVEQPLSDLGAACTTRKGFLPIVVKGPLKGGHARVDASIGSQFLTGLLVALPKAEKDSVLSVERLMSIPYIELTLQLLNQFKISVSHQDFKTFKIKGGQNYQKGEYHVEGDWSSAAFIMVAAALTGAVRIRGLDRDSLQGDKQILDVLDCSGAKVKITPQGIEVSKASLKAFEFDVTHRPDLAPPLVALACHAQGMSVLWGMSRLAYKESNRAEALLQEFKSLGVDIRQEGDRLSVRGGTIRGGRVDSHRDHRLAMALAVAALAAESTVSIEGAECVSKSYPDFFKDLSCLGARIYE